MGELTPHAQEAMNQEVELLMNISAASRRRRGSRTQRKKASEEPTAEALATATE
jgi:hypothetical protein